jgi:hypothetical protein
VADSTQSRRAEHRGLYLTLCRIVREARRSSAAGSPAMRQSRVASQFAAFGRQLRRHEWQERRRGVPARPVGGIES